MWLAVANANTTATHYWLSTCDAPGIVLRTLLILPATADCYTIYYVPSAVVVYLTSTHRYNAVRGHRTGSSNSGAEDYLRRETNTSN